MRKKSYLITGLIALVVVAIIFLMTPVAGNADILPYSRFSGPVTLDGQNVPAGSVVSAWINGMPDGTGTVYMQGSASWYVLNAPENTGGQNKNGGVNGDSVHFSVNINGSVIQDPASAVWQWAGDVYHRIALSRATSPLQITTAALPDGAQGTAYTFLMTATGGVGAYNWSASGLPAGLSLNATTGIIFGNPTVSGNFSAAVTVTDSASPPNSKTQTYNLHVSASSSNLIITTTVLTRWSVEVFPANPPSSWLPLPVPGWIINQPYSTTLTATGGIGALTWSASGLPPGLTIDPATGIISGTPTLNGLYEIVIDVHDSASPPNTAHEDPALKIYKVGDANGNDTVSIADVTYVERVILGLNAPTAGCDANLSNSITIADVTKIERIILGLP